MEQNRKLVLLFFIIFLEGYIVLSAELLAIRQTLPFVGSGTDTVSIIIAAVLMPLAFGSILGGMTTLVGTPPNLIVSGFRAQTGAGTFVMFDFTPVGLTVAAAGVAFVALAGWRLVPARGRVGAEGFDTGAYLTEARVPEDSRAVGMPLGNIEAALGEADAQVVGLVRNDMRLTAPSPGRVVRAGDILVIEAEATALTMKPRAARIPAAMNPSDSRAMVPRAMGSDWRVVARSSRATTFRLSKGP